MFLIHAGGSVDHAIGATKPNTGDERNSSSKTTDSFTKISQAFSTWLAPPSSPSDDGHGTIQVEPAAKESDGVFLPAVHSVHGNQLQWNIFHRQIVASLPKVCSQFKLDLPEAQETLTNMAKQFK